VLEPVRLKRDQPAAQRHDLRERAAGPIDLQLAAIFGSPVLIEIDHGRYRTYVGTDQPIEMPRVRRAGRIQREMPLVILEPGHELAIERHLQFIEPCEQPLLGIAFGMCEPRNKIAAHFRNQPLVRTETNARGAQCAGRVQLDAAIVQCLAQLSVDKLIDHAEPAFGELLDQARRRVRSFGRPTRTRRVLRLFVARVVFGADFGRRCVFFGFSTVFLGGHNMVPRHCGEPQRHA
jgi:hypothetical protein